MITRVWECILKNFEVLKTPTEVTQFLRGEFYVYTDSLISSTMNLTDPDYPLIYEFVGEAIALILLWLKIFP